MDSRQQEAFERRHGRHSLSDPANRGKLFMPFAALKGYYGLIGQRSMDAHATRLPLSPEEEDVLNRALSRLKAGDMVDISYYEGDALVSEKTAVGHIDQTARTLRLKRTVVNFGDIAQLEIDTEL